VGISNKEPSSSPSIWPPSFGSTFTFLFLLFKKANLDDWGLSFFGGKITSNLIWRSRSSYKLLEEEKDDQP
jgi:hypothetical protein